MKKLKEPYTHSKQHYTHSKEPYTHSKEPYTQSKQHYTHSKQPYTHSKEDIKIGLWISGISFVSKRLISLISMSLLDTYINICIHHAYE